MLSKHSICFDIESYLDENKSIIYARNSMYDDISKQIQLLLKNNYIITVESLDKDLICIKYNLDRHLTKSNIENPFWILENEYKEVLKGRLKEEEFQLKLP